MGATRLRWMVGGLLALLASAGLAGLGVWLSRGDLSRADQLASVGSFISSLLALVVAVVAIQRGTREATGDQQSTQRRQRARVDRGATVVQIGGDGVVHLAPRRGNPPAESHVASDAREEGSGARSDPSKGPTSCDAVGHSRGGLHPVLGRPFRLAYNAAGGRARLGCPRSDDPSGFVGPWGPGWRQDLRGGTEGVARIMTLDATSEVVVMSGRFYDDYTNGSGLGPNSGPVLGYPTSPPKQVGAALVVRLTGGEAGPGLMVSDPTGRMRWLRGPFARRWLELGGPDGPLGRPVSDYHDAPDGQGELQEFEHDSLRVSPDADTAMVGSGRAVVAQTGSPVVRKLWAELEQDLRRFSAGSLEQIRHRPPSRAASAGVQAWDVFISHASEDKETVAKPLADALRARGVTVWLDRTELRIGDSLRAKIDLDLANSRFGVVVFSPSFFAKGWPRYELDGLVMREVSGEQTLLPLWHKITKAELMARSPSLADKIARSTEEFSIEDIADEIAAVVLPGADPED
jgi:hypothetical protein